MNIYYTEYPRSEFTAKSDDEALKQTIALFVYRESDTDNGIPFIILRQ